MPPTFVAPPPETAVFALRGPDGEPEWYAMINGRIVKASFNSKGAALAAIPVELARRAKATQ